MYICTPFGIVLWLQAIPYYPKKRILYAVVKVQRTEIQCRYFSVHTWKIVMENCRDNYHIFQMYVHHVKFPVYGEWTQNEKIHIEERKKNRRWKSFSCFPPNQPNRWNIIIYANDVAVTNASQKVLLKIKIALNIYETIDWNYVYTYYPIITIIIMHRACCKYSKL